MVSDRPRIALARRYYLPPCQSKEVIKRGFDDTEPARQRYECHGCHGRFDDLTDTILDQRGHLNRYAVQHIFVPLLVRRAKLGFASQGQVLTPEALARHRVPSVASEAVMSPAKRTQGGDGPQRARVKGLSPVMDMKCRCRHR